MSGCVGLGTCSEFNLISKLSQGRNAKCESLRVKFSVSASSFAAFADACDLFPALTAKIIIERFPKNKKYSEKGRIRDMNSKQCYSKGGSRNRDSILAFILLCKANIATIIM